MRSSKHGRCTSAPEVTNISQHGLWIFFRGAECFVPYSRNPWFKNATVAQIQNVKLEGKSVLHWPDLDVDLDVQRIVSPEQYPLVSRKE